MTVINIITDLEGLVLESKDVPVEVYDGPTLRALADCANALGIDILVQTYENAYHGRTPSIPDPQQLFDELKRLFRDNHLTINLYLVIMGARRGTYLLQLPTPEENRNLRYLADKYGLYLTPNPTASAMMITKEPVHLEQLRDDLYIAYLLDYGCLDPFFNNVDVPRVGYHFDAYIQDISYRIMSFACTVPYRVSPQRLEEIRSQFQRAIQQIDPKAQVIYSQKEVPGMQRQVTL